MVSGKNKLPDRWLDYTPMGKKIEGTQIIPFKVPLREEICRGKVADEEKWFTPSDLLNNQPNLKMIVDLTMTYRYYNPSEFASRGIDHVKIMVEGRGQIPPDVKVREFFRAADDFLEKHSNDPDALMGVHCTHGLNRTGYFICRYMVERLNFTPNDAIARFEEARGCPMEREYLINHIRTACILNKPSEKIKENPYSSPLEDVYEENIRSRGYTNWRQSDRRSNNGPSSGWQSNNWTTSEGKSRNRPSSSRQSNSGTSSDSQSNNHPSSSRQSNNWKQSNRPPNNQPTSSRQFHNRTSSNKQFNNPTSLVRQSNNPSSSNRQSNNDNPTTSKTVNNLKSPSGQIRNIRRK